ncbi:phytoene desaturase [Actinoplanes sp. TBRC 11911]|uniref:phytoene desaturase family protein n=1 Tax=Actinoplanes sp. TBRC 11911 TaxID=2729386 RepID=UPI00145DCF0D|nr:phytoene desaturase family protein [Actinoplanes sp. TBRC 11911]NMO55774.1 phytoene desaturase [Actinoplanes sp. TBRC 11911]
MSRIVVIGAGVGGLTAAIRLASAGHEVVVHERAAVPGGKLGVYSRDGFVFDTGPSLLTLPQVFDSLPAGAEALDPIVRHVFPDGTVLDSCSSHEEFLGRITAALGPAAAADWHRFWGRAEHIWRASWRSVLRKPVTPASLLALSWRVGDLAAIAPRRTLSDLAWHYLRDPRLRMMAERYATYAGADPRRAPAALAAIPYAELEFGGWYLPGGLGTLASDLAARCKSLGVAIHLNSEISEISVSNQPTRVTGVRLADGGFEAADFVVSNVDALTVYRDLLPTPSRLARLSDRSLAGFVLLLGVRGRTPALAHHNVFFPRYYHAEFDAIFGSAGRRATLASDPTIFVTRANDPAVHPPDSEAWFVLVNAPRHGTAWSAVDWQRPGLAEAYGRHVLNVLAGRGVEVRDRLLFMETRTPHDLAVSAGAPGGAIYGTAATLVRPPNKGPVGNLYLVGGSVHPGGGLPMVTLSAQMVADEIGPAR